MKRTDDIKSILFEQAIGTRCLLDILRHEHGNHLCRICEQNQ
ncbi:MAG TPA: hypothetical protein VL122_04815 [Nitrospirota bacterium]|nr:hypothetical protein [Nitrospirota bacterium]